FQSLRLSWAALDFCLRKLSGFFRRRMEVIPVATPRRGPRPFSVSLLAVSTQQLVGIRCLQTALAVTIPVWALERSYSTPAMKIQPLVLPRFYSPQRVAIRPLAPERF